MNHTVHTVVHFEIPADDPERAASFYRGLFGWKIQKSEHSGPMEYWMVSTVPTDATGRPTENGVNGGLLRRMHPQHMAMNYINVESVDKFAEKAESLGGEIAMPKTPVPGMGAFALIKDTEGNVFGVWENAS